MVAAPYIQVCGRQNPNLNRCVENSVINLLPKLKDGISELDVPSLEPLDIDEIALVNLKDFDAVATNAKVSGLSKFQIKYLQVDLNSRKIDINIVFPKIILNSDFNVNARILVPISEKGPINLTTGMLHFNFFHQHLLTKAFTLSPIVYESNNG